MENTSAFWQAQIFRKNFRERLKLHHIERLFGTASGDMRCLVAGGTPALHQAIHHFRGQWVSAAFSQDEYDALSMLTDDKVILCENHRFPGDREEFDRIIIVETFEKLEDDGAFMAECHRILKNSGILLLCSVHRRKYSALHLLRHLLDVHPANTASHRNGYTGAELFDLLKDGFDVQETHTFSRFFTESGHLLISVLGGFFIRTSPPPLDNQALQADFYHRVYRHFSLMWLPSWLLAQLDVLFFFTKGHLLIARAKKRMWRPRKTPVLRDGRSIAEATLGAKIGSALEY